MTGSRRSAMLVMWLLMSAASANAQVQSSPPQTLPEDLEPRIIGTTGTMMVGFAGYVDRVFSFERFLPANYTVQVDVGRFISRRLVVRGGFAGSGSVGGEDSEERSTGTGAPALHALGGLFFYFTPQSIASFYSGAEYWAQLTQRAPADAGSIVGKLGLQGALSSRASLFLAAGYGVGLTRDEEATTRIVGQVGVRLKL